MSDKHNATYRPLVCPECGDDTLESIEAVNTCATMDAVEARQLRAAAKKRKTWDSNIVKSSD